MRRGGPPIKGVDKAVNITIRLDSAHRRLVRLLQGDGTATDVVREAIRALAAARGVE